MQEDQGKQLRSFDVENKAAFMFFKLCCIVAIKRKYGQYVISNVMFIMFYTLWVVWPLSGFSLAVFSASLFSGEQSSDMFHNETLESSLFVLCFIVVPALQAYSLKFINKCLPQVLEDISLLGCINVGFETPLKVCHVSKIKESTEKLKKAVHGECFGKETHPDRLFHWLPLAVVAASVSAFFTVWIIGIVVNVDLETVKEELPLLTVNFSYQCLPFVTTIFVIFFIRWHTKAYQSLHIFCNESSASWNKSQILALCMYVNKLQDIFAQLSDGLFRYILGINMITIIISAILCTAKVLLDARNFIYVEPLICNVFILTLICVNSSTLMDKVSSTWCLSESYRCTQDFDYYLYEIVDEDILRRCSTTAALRHSNICSLTNSMRSCCCC